MRRSTAGPVCESRLGFAHSSRWYLDHAAFSRLFEGGRPGQSSETGMPVILEISCSTGADLYLPKDAEHTAEGEIDSLSATPEKDVPASAKRY